MDEECEMMQCMRELSPYETVTVHHAIECTLEQVVQGEVHFPASSSSEHSETWHVRIYISRANI